MPRLSLRFAPPLLSFVIATAALARADDVADKEQAKVLVSEGRRLRDEKKDHPGALVRFRAAWDLVKTPIIGLDLAREYVGAGKLVEAYGVCDEVRRIPKKSTDSALSVSARADAEALGDDLHARIPRLSITLGPHAETPAPTVLLDGAVLPPAALLVPRDVNPGSHELTVRVGEKTSTTKVTLAEREAKSIELVVPTPPVEAPKAEPAAVLAKPEPTPAANVATPIAPNSARRDEAPRDSSQRTIAIVTGTVGVVGMGIGGWLGLSARSSYADAESAHCRGNVCDAVGKQLTDDARARGNVATIVFGLGAAAVAGGVVLWLTAPSPQDTKRDVAIGVVPGGVVVGGHF